MEFSQILENSAARFAGSQKLLIWIDPGLTPGAYICRRSAAH